MPRRITLQPHLTTAELYRRYRACRRPQEKLRWRALYLISGGELANHAARRVGRSSGRVSALTRRYNERGAEAVPDARGDVAPGRRPRLDAAAARDLDAALRAASADGGLWTAPKVAAWIAPSAPAPRSMPARRGELCAGSASPYRCRARATAARRRPRSRRRSKKARRHALGGEADTPRRGG